MPAPSVELADGRLEVRADAYSLVVGRPDRPFARLADAAGNVWADLALIASASTLDGPDEWWSLDPVAVEDAPCQVARIVARTSRWRAAVLRLELHPDHLRARLELDGEGLLTDVELFAGMLSARPAMGTGRFESGRRFRSVVPGGPADPTRIVIPAGEAAQIGVVGDSRPGRGRWFFTPGPLAFALALREAHDALMPPPGPWLALGIDPGPADSAGFTSFDYLAGDGSFSVRLRYEGHTRVAGHWASPDVLLVPGAADPYDAVRRAIALRRASPTAEAPTPGWWLEPMFCGWGAQVAAAPGAGAPAAMLSRRDRYDAWLARLEAAGVVPGTIVVDDKWQRTYGRNEPDESRWPDLRGWIDARHARGQRVLLWWKAWDPEGLPPEQTIRTPAGVPVAADPTNPRYERLLRASIRGMLARDPDALDADGLKLDFTGATPSGTSLRTFAESQVGAGSGPWGIGLLHRLLSIVADEARATKPDALIVTHAPDPLFRDVSSMVRLNDALRLDDPEPLVPVIAQLRHRAALIRAADPAVPIDTDDWAMPSRAEWLEWQRTKIDVGVPALYHVDTLAPAGEAITHADLAVVARTWAAYRAQRAVMDPQGPNPRGRERRGASGRDPDRPVNDHSAPTLTVLALDVGGTKLAAGVVDSDGTLRSFVVRPTGREDGPDAMIERLIGLGRQALERAASRPGDLARIGIGCGGPLDPVSGVIHGTTNLPGWQDVRLTDRVRDAFGIAAVVENDATAAAMAEWRWGAGRGTRHLVYLTLSTGIGGGAIADGRPVRGASGNATELGHLTVRYDGWPCACGRRGCPEAFASGTNVARRAREAGMPPTTTARDVVAAAAKGDPTARGVWDETTEVIGELVATALNAFDPEIVVLGGGLTGAGALLLEPVVQRAHAVAMPPMRRTPIVIAALGERVGVLGAAAVALDRAALDRAAEAELVEA